MTETRHYALVVLLVAAVGLVSVLSSRLTETLKIPTPLLVLAGSAVAVKVIPAQHAPDETTVERIVTVALVLILFDGGMNIGRARFREAAAPIALVGVLGTCLTAAAGAAVLHVGFGLSWYLALLVATAVAPTDPAVVFSVLSNRRIEGRSSTILEGESGANDPVGIALVASLLAAGGLSSSAFGRVGLTFVLQMGVGLAIGIVGGAGLLGFMRRVRLPSEGLFPLRTLACALLLYGAATLAHGSGFLAVFAAGIVIGDGAAPYKREVERFHSALASLAEIVVFVVLGLTVDLGVLTRADVLVPGVVLGIVGAVVVRPLLVGVCLLPARLARNERRFVLFAGLKGAVPILLGEMIRATHPPDADRLYGIVVIVVVLSVALQGSLVPKAADLLRLPVRIVEPQPWALGVRLRDEPEGAHRVTVVAGSAADGSSLVRAAELAGEVWISMVVRDSELVALRPDSRLAAGDEVVILAAPEQTPALDAFLKPATDG